ncbi:MAG: biopolymer transporter TolR [Bacteroidetes bacterium]|nr:biopolymer transporter TolR [Bacteroidota bacterium]
MKQILTLAYGLLAVLSIGWGQVGIFEKTADVGPVLHQGSTDYDTETGRYELTGSGANIWFTKDEFHFAYKKIKGDFILQCRGRLLDKGVEAHRKFGWMVRTDLDTTAAMVSATVHGDGTAAIQYRKKPGTRIEEVKSPVKSPDIIQLERRGRSYFLSLARFGDPFWTVEVPDFDFPEELLVGLFICAHNKDVLEKAEFDNVRIYIPAKPGFTPYRDYIGSHIEIMDVVSGNRKIIHSAPNSLQAPNWLPNDKGLIYNSEGQIFKLDFASGKPTVLNTDFVTRNNNDHVISFDGKMLGLSSSSGEQEYGSLIYTVPLAGGTPKRITATGPSYLHCWSPDGKWLTFTGGRNGNFDIYKIPSDGGEEVRLTTSPALEDSPEYSPDGQWIYFNSTRTGSMDLWRMRPDGSFPEQLTNDEYQDWFPHFSPDGKWIVFISFPPEVKVDDHPFYQQVYLRIMPAAGGKPRIIGYLYGGQGTINTPSWSPDGKKIAFVSNSTM